MERIGFENAAFQWYSLSKGSKYTGGFKLGPLNLSFPLKEFSLVTGATGSGKSALLAALLGGKLAYLLAASLSDR